MADNNCGLGLQKETVFRQFLTSQIAPLLFDGLNKAAIYSLWLKATARQK